MQKILKIHGMMCGHCAARVKESLEALPAVERAEVSHETGTAVLELNRELPDSALENAIEDLGYELTR